MKRTIAIGDIHGCYYTLVSLLRELNINFEEDRVIFLGDYIDRGKYPLKTVLAIKDIALKHTKNVICLKGNHEDMCCRYYFNGDKIWSWNGYERSFEEIENYEKKDELLSWMNSLPVRYETEDYCFCHSGNWSTDKIPGYEVIQCLWDRDWLKYGLPNNCDKGKPIIFGHTPHIEPTYYDNNICIDTGICYPNKGLGTLTAAILEKNRPAEFFSVKIEGKDNY